MFMDKMEIMLIKTLILEEIQRLEDNLNNTNNTYSYMQAKDLQNRYKEILQKL